jgi:hypothetical protein
VNKCKECGQETGEAFNYLFLALYLKAPMSQKRKTFVFSFPFIGVY